MKINKTKSVIFAILFLCIGYVSGAFIGVPFVDNRMLSGDISKAKLYNNSTGADANASIERLRNDTIYRQQLLTILIIQNSRIITADSLATATAKATESIKTLTDINKSMNTLTVKAKNAQNVYKKLFSETEKVLAGKEVTGYEELVNNANHAFSVIENEISSCTKTIDALTEFGLHSNNASVLASASGWIKYGAEDAILSGNKNAVNAWELVYASALKQPSLARNFNSNFKSLQSNFATMNMIALLNKNSALFNIKSIEALNKTKKPIW